jgi:hypothetical protein
VKPKSPQKKSQAVVRVGDLLPVLTAQKSDEEPGLHDLAETINELYGKQINYADGSRNAARYAIECAVLCGGYLRRVKASLHETRGRLTEWIRLNTNIDPRTARNYMRLNMWLEQHRSDILEHKPRSLRQFYILAGILPEDGPKKLLRNKLDDLARLRRLVRQLCLEVAKHRDYCQSQELFTILRPLIAVLEEVSTDVNKRKHVSAMDSVSDF